MTCCHPTIYCWLVLAGPLVLLCTAVYARYYHANISAKRATVDFMVSQEANSKLADDRRIFGQAGSKGFGYLKSLLDAVSSGSARAEQWSEYASINVYLNHCEMVAVAIGSGALDEGMYKKSNRSLYVQAWDRSKEYIQYARSVKAQPSMYEHFEALAKNWTA